MPPFLINTSNCRKLAMRLRRCCEGQEAVSLNNVQKMFEGTNADRLSLLRQFLSSGENIKKVEATLEFSREVEAESTGVEQLLTIEGMKKAGVSGTLRCIPTSFGSDPSISSGEFHGVCYCLPFLDFLGRRLQQLSAHRALPWILNTQRFLKKLAIGALSCKNVSVETKTR